MGRLYHPKYKEAEDLRKLGHYDKAAELFGHVWKEAPSPEVGWRYASCLRKANRLAEAEHVAREAIASFPEDRYIRTELGWVLYFRYLKDSALRLEEVLNKAKEVFSLNPSELVLVRTALTVIKVAKEDRRWDVVLEWADRIDPTMLQNSAPEHVTSRMSDLETWYINRSRSLLELQKFEDAVKSCQEGLALFPKSVYLRRILAQAYAKRGDFANAATQLRGALYYHPNVWYMKAELAEIEYLMGNRLEAYRLMCEAISNPKTANEHKVNYLVALAKISLSLGKLVESAANLALAKKIRNEQGWGIPKDLTDTEHALVQAFHSKQQPWPDLPNNILELNLVCKSFWESGQTEGLNFRRGTIKPYPPERAFAFIKPDDGGEDIYVDVRDLPRECSSPGSRVEFLTKRAFDKKKQRESLRADKVRCCP